jgi:8-oxo-dGTP pyrophosphatase MutT (NUDIX family)
MKLPEATTKLMVRILGGASRSEGEGLPIQTGALPWRMGPGNRAEILLVTGRNSGQWIIPKGWPMRGKTLAKAAAQEAFEEAGVKGTISVKPLGRFRHTKQFSVLKPVVVDVIVHALSVDRELSSWPEHGQRQRKWTSTKQPAG